MASADDPRRESEAARQRMTEIALEIAERTRSEQLRNYAVEKKDEWTAKAREKVQEKAHETAEDFKDAARSKAHDLKEAAVDKTVTMKDRAVGSPGLLAATGGLIGALAGWYLSRSGALQSHDRARYGYGRYGGRYGYDERRVFEGPYTGRAYSADETGGEFYGGDRYAAGGSRFADEARGKAEEMKERATEAIDSAKSGVEHAVERVREKVPSAGEMKERAQDYYHRASEEYPVALALGSLAFGFLSALLVPVSERERRALDDVKRKAQHGIEQIGHKVEEQISGAESSEAEPAKGAGQTTSASASEFGTSEPERLH